jgi:predicted RNA-binding Zn-ribbon protein involved in translation (DUF1610 family)
MTQQIAKLAGFGIEINHKTYSLRWGEGLTDLIWIKGKAVPAADSRKMEESQRPPIRPCPLCGIAMQASKSRETEAGYDTFRCLTCGTTIVEQPPSSRQEEGESG